MQPAISRRSPLIATCLAALLLVMTAAVARAQDQQIFAAPDNGSAGDLITLRGIAFNPGGYEAIVFWDGEPSSQLKIPDGGDFSATYRIPPEADPGEHSIRVCAAFRPASGGDLSCFTGEFEQSAETPFVVTDALPIRICKEPVDECAAFSNATVYNVTTGKVFGVDRAGYVTDRAGFAAGDAIWALAPNSTGPGYTLNFTSGEPAAVDTLFFDPQAEELWLGLSLDHPLHLQDLTVAAAWHVQGHPAYAAQLTRNLQKASRYLYDFTEGQMALGEITIYQGLDQWETADVRLYGSNTLRPNAVIGGSVMTDTPDLNPVLNLIYQPGTVDMGSQWNRFGVPPGQQVTYENQQIDTATLTDDWSMAFAHELGHYLLFLYDTYRDRAGNDSVEVAAQCFGSAMSDVYRTENHAFISDPATWKARCGNTEAYGFHAGRTEWETILWRYPALMAPQGDPQPDVQPAELTTVTFIAPSETPGAPILDTVFDLNYQENETSSGEARAFLYRNDRIFEQGKPIKNVNQVTLTGPEAGDMLCVYDVNDYSLEDANTPRHQFGCETIQPSDNALEMTKNAGWRPVVTLQQVATDTVRISVTQQLPPALLNALTAKIYPEHQQGLAPQSVPPIADADLGTDLVLPGPVPPLYVQLYIDETVGGLSTRRETVLDRGTGGGGLFGPVSKYGGVLVYSSDGKAGYAREGDLELAAGESIAWQSMAGTPTIPAGKQITGQAYRLDAFPDALVADGTIRIDYEDVAGAVHAARQLHADATPSVHFFDGTTWIPLASEVTVPNSAADGYRSVEAPSRGPGIYAVLYDAPVSRIWLPYILAR